VEAMQSLPTPSSTPTSAVHGDSDMRREARYVARIPVTVNRGRRAVSLVTEDVSFRGVFLRMDPPPALRHLVRLEIALPDGTRIRAHAIVHRISAANDQAQGVGLEFFAMGGRERALWEALVVRIREEEPVTEGSFPAP